MPFIDRIDAQREIIRQSLDEIAAEVGTRTGRGGDYLSGLYDRPQFWNLARNGRHTTRPAVEDWSKVMAIVCRIIERRVGTGELRGRELPCAMANATMGAADVTAE